MLALSSELKEELSPLLPASARFPPAFSFPSLQFFGQSCSAQSDPPCRWVDNSNSMHSVTTMMATPRT